MFNFFGSRNTVSKPRKKRAGKASLIEPRRLCVESLEPRRLLSSIGLNVVSNAYTGATATSSSTITLDAGTSMLLALNGNDPGETVNFGVSSSNPSDVTASLMPSTNKTVQFDIAGEGDVNVQLFDNLTPTTASHIETLVNDGFYNGDYIYRAQSGFVLQGGNDPPSINGGAGVNTLPSGVPSTIDEEFNPDLMYTSAGTFAMARTSSPNTSGTEFFITESTNDAQTEDSLDYSYTEFGFQTTDPTASGSSQTIDQAIQAMPTETSSGFSYLNTPIKITSASIITDTQNGVVELRAPTGVTGTFTVTVTASDGTNTPVTQTFNVNVVANPITGAVANPWASKTPAAPASVVFQPGSGQGSTTETSANNSSTSEELNFLVSGTTSGDTVTLYANGQAIGSTVASGTTATVTTNGTTTLSNATYTFTATQTAPNVSASFTDSGGSSRTESANVDSYASPGVQLQVANTSLQITSTPATTATVGQVYTYVLQTNASAGDTITVNTDGGTNGASTLPAGMTFDSSNDTFTWTPTGNEEGTTETFSATITDSAGNSVTLGPIHVQVASNNVLTVVAPAPDIAIGSPVLVGFNDSNTSATNFTVTTSNPSELTATLTPETNPVLQIVTNLGTMDFQLLQNLAANTPGTPNTVQHIEDLISAGDYDPSTYTSFTGTFGLQVGTSSGALQTGVINFEASNLTATAANIQSALVALGFTGATVTVDPSSAAPNFSFDVTFKNSEPDLSYLQAASPLPVTFANSDSSGSAATQTITFTTYTPSFYRVLAGFMSQGGVIGSGVGGDIPVELNNDLRFTSTGLLAMANDGVDGNSSEFFVTDPSTSNITSSSGVTTYADMADGFLDFRYTIFGKLISGDNVRVAIADTPVTTNSSGEDSEPTTPITIESMSIITDAQAGVFMLTSQPGATGTYTVTVSDGLGNTQTFTVNASDPTTGAAITNTYDPSNPYLEPIKVGVNSAGTNPGDQIYTSANAAVTFTPQGESADGAAFTISVQLLGGLEDTASSSVLQGVEVDQSFFSTNIASSYTALSADFTLTQSGSSWTITPNSGFVGAGLLEVTIEANTVPSWDASSNVDPFYRAFVPVYVSPPSIELTSISAGGETVTGSTFDNNSSSSTELSFNVNGATSGETVYVYDNGGTTPIASGTATGSTVTVVSNGTVTIPDGQNIFTVEQSINTGSLTAYVNWTANSSGSYNPGTQFGIPSATLDSPASAGTTLTIGLAVLEQPVTSARVESVYTFAVLTNAPAGDTITVNATELPPGMVLDPSDNTFTWTPTSAQLSASYPFEATVTDSTGRTTTIGPVSIDVILGLVPTPIPVDSAGGDVTVVFEDGNALIYDNLTKAVLSYQSFKSSDIVEVDLPTGQANAVMVILPSTSGTAIPKEVYVNGNTGSTQNQVTVYGTSKGHMFTVSGNTITADSLEVVDNNVQKLTLAGMAGDNYYSLGSSAVPTWIVNQSKLGTLDFSQDAAGVTVNLGLDGGQAQNMSGWNTSLMLYGVLNEVIGTAYADTLTGGPAATTIIRSGGGNDALIGGSGNNVLVGGGGNDTIMGGHSDNLLIGGSGTSDMYAEGSENLAFGGSTSYDTNDQALLALLAEGPLVSFGYNVRLALASAAKNPSAPSSLMKFTDSGAHDIIFSSGSDDWFVPGKYGVVEKT